MSNHEVEKSSSTDGLPISPALGPSLQSAKIHKHSLVIDRRVMWITFLAVILGGFATLIAQTLTRLIGLITNLSFYGTLSTDFTSPSKNTLGLWVIVIPAIGGLIVGFMARYGSKAIRGHGIPEAMEQILLNESRIPARITFLKPLSAAIAIGTGGPFGAEGPIIATGGALGSLMGQIILTSASERKTLLAAGAAAGMTAIFGSPVSAVLLAIELLLFEFKPRSFVPVALAATTAAILRISIAGSEPVFKMTELAQPSASAFMTYILEGALMGIVAVVLTKAVYWIEDAFEHLPIHWMWWPTLGGLVVGVIGFISPATLGVGYENIDHILSGNFVGSALIFFIVMKFLSWSIALGSGTSGGTLAPIFTIGGGIGAAFGSWIASTFPSIGVDIRIAALVGMAGSFAGASRALLTSVLFAFETTRQPHGLLPLLGGCTASFLVSAVLMRHTIMTERLARRGHHVPVEYSAEYSAVS